MRLVVRGVLEQGRKRDHPSLCLHSVKHTALGSPLPAQRSPACRAVVLHAAATLTTGSAFCVCGAARAGGMLQGACSTRLQSSGATP